MTGRTIPIGSWYARPASATLWEIQSHIEPSAITGFTVSPGGNPRGREYRPRPLNFKSILLQQGREVIESLIFLKSQFRKTKQHIVDLLCRGCALRSTSATTPTFSFLPAVLPSACSTMPQVNGRPKAKFALSLFGYFDFVPTFRGFF